MYCKTSSDYIEFSTSECNILQNLLEKEGQLCSRYELESIGWGGKPVSSSSLSVVITSLRKKLSPIKSIVIMNTPGKGYYVQLTKALIDSSQPERENESLEKVCIESKRYKFSFFFCIGANLLFIITLLVGYGLYSTLKVNFLCKEEKSKISCFVDGYEGSSLHRGYEQKIKEGDMVFLINKHSIIINKNGEES